ncbi:HD domain-containing protein [Patescibacteria group bacterium]|nr:MAG: HD domain-containing protein [Patescibacteria group bacterium]
MPERVSWVRIPPSPPGLIRCGILSIESTTAMPELLIHPEESEESKFHSPLEERDKSDSLRQLEQQLGGSSPRVEGEGDERHMVLPREPYTLYEHALHRPETRFHLADLKKLDPETHEHTMGVTQNAVALAWINRHLEGITAEDIKILAQAGFLHDIGKLDLPKLQQNDKKGNLTDEMVLAHQVKRRFKSDERKKVKLHSHPLLSVRRLQREHPVDDPRILALVALHHQLQEYPTLSSSDAESVMVDLGIHSKEDRKKIRILQQFLEAGDKFDAMDNYRPYREGEEPPTPKEIEDDIKKNFIKRGANPKFAYQIMDLYYPDRYQTPEYQDNTVPR